VSNVSAGSDPAALYLQLIMEGHGDDLLGLFDGVPLIDDPGEGRIEGRDAVLSFVEAGTVWFRERQASIEPLRVTRGDSLSVAESKLHFSRDGGQVELPTAVAAERGASGGLKEIRVYHSHWPLTSSHRVRPPLLEADPGLELPDVVERYQRALAEGDLEEILDLFEPDGYAREPAGGEYVHRGQEELREFYGALFSAGGIPLEHCTLTDDGVCCAIEYNVVRWGHIPLAPQAGIAVYERGTPGRLAAARIYDDVAVEEEVK
jgi:hypothetical protein